MASRTRTILLFPALSGLESHSPGWGAALWQPRVDVYQLEEALLIQIEAPGLRVEDLRLDFENGELVVEGRREQPALPGPAQATLVEMNYGPFHRTLPLPADCDGDGIRATYDAGILQIWVPRRPPQAPANRRVAIE